MNENAKIKVILVEDNQLLIDGIQAMFKGDKDVEFVGSANNGQEADLLVDLVSPDVILMDWDLSMPEEDGIAVLEMLLKKNPSLKVLMLTNYDDIALIRESLSKGAKGYVLKNIDRVQLIKAIIRVSEGKHHLDPDVQEKVLGDWLPDENGNNKPGGNTKTVEHNLSSREMEVAQLIAKGKTSKEIAELLFISVNTVDTHRKKIFSKIKVKNIAELIKFLMEQGLL